MTPALDSSLVEDTVIRTLLDDAALSALCPDGVWWDFAGEDCQRYVIVSLVSELDVSVFGGRGYEDYLLLVKAVMLNASSVDMRAAVQRFDVLLDDPPPLPVPGYAWMCSYREHRIRYTEVDVENPLIRWLHRGAHYRVQVALPTDTPIDPNPWEQPEWIQETPWVQ